MLLAWFAEPRGLAAHLRGLSNIQGAGVPTRGHMWPPWLSTPVPTGGVQCCGGVGRVLAQGASWKNGRERSICSSPELSCPCQPCPGLWKWARGWLAMLAECPEHLAACEVVGYVLQNVLKKKTRAVAQRGGALLTRSKVVAPGSPLTLSYRVLNTSETAWECGSPLRLAK